MLVPPPRRGLERVPHARVLQRDPQVLPNLEPPQPSQRRGQSWLGSLFHDAPAPVFRNDRAAPDDQVVQAHRFAKVETPSNWSASRSDATAAQVPVRAPGLQRDPGLRRGPVCPAA